ncbi:hypothetical protein LJC33_01885 [Eubacteriales bacterium OttesenSCG-928-N13]|nr:hypothetical protein [Eubacteriales bacterium OttesenSCG-928-N13]
MNQAQPVRDSAYLTALSIFKNLHGNGLIADRELVRIASFLANRFSASEVVRIRKIA